jgi:hypothetical protein
MASPSAGDWAWTFEDEQRHWIPDHRIRKLRANEHAVPLRGSAHTLGVIEDATGKFVGYVLTEDLGHADVRAWIAATGWRQKAGPRGGKGRGPRGGDLSFARAALARYGAALDDEARIVRDGKPTRVRAVIKGGRLRFEGDVGNLLFSGPPTETAVANFVESFWFWKPRAAGGKQRRAGEYAIVEPRTGRRRWQGGASRATVRRAQSKLSDLVARVMKDVR